MLIKTENSSRSAHGKIRCDKGRSVLQSLNYIFRYSVYKIKNAYIVIPIIRYPIEAIAAPVKAYGI